MTAIVQNSTPQLNNSQINQEFARVTNRLPYDIEKCLELIAAGADVNAKDKDGRTAIMKAARHGDTALVEKLLAAAASPEGAVLAAAKHGHPTVVDMLINAKAPLNETTEEGNTALIIASRTGKTKIATALIDAGADIHHANNNGDTALIWAASNNHVDILRFLIDAGGDIFAGDCTGTTALTWAKRRGHAEAAEILQKEEFLYIDRLAHHGSTETRTTPAVPEMKKIPFPGKTAP